MQKMTRVQAALNRLAKWRTVFAGWQLGTRDNKDPEAAAVRDAREAQLLLRVEVTALTALLVEKGIIGVGEFEDQLVLECELQNKLLEEKFPGFKAVDDGLIVDPLVAKNTTKDWPK